MQPGERVVQYVSRARELKQQLASEAPIAVAQSDSKRAGGVNAAGEAAPNVAPVARAKQAEQVEPANERAKSEQDEEEAQHSAAQSDDEGDSAQRINDQSSSQAGDESSSDDDEEAPPAPRCSARLALLRGSTLCGNGVQ
eukprot:155845-Pelagomonas_calceolata.AAC.1